MEDDDNILWNMYGGGSVTPKPSAPPPEKFKMASRVIGGMKAQNSHTKTIELDGEFHTFPKAEYVAQLEAQLKEVRQQFRDLQTKQQRLVRANNRALEKIRQIEIELANKIDAR